MKPPDEDVWDNVTEPSNLNQQSKIISCKTRFSLFPTKMKNSEKIWLKKYKSVMIVHGNGLYETFYITPEELVLYVMKYDIKM